MAAVRNKHAPRARSSLSSLRYRAVPVRDYLRGKNVLVVGLGVHGGGAGAVRFLAKNGAHVLVTDLRRKKVLAPALAALRGLKNVRYVLGCHRERDLYWAELIVKNPGVPPHSPYIRRAEELRVPITSDMGIFFALSRARIVGVTGTRGKSTAAYLIGKFLAAGYKKGRVFVGGNIRVSVLDFLENLKVNDIAVLELSSFQLADLSREKKSPEIAVITNIMRDHLNWHQSFRDYVHAKSSIFRFQKSGDYLFINGENPRLRSLAASAPSRVVHAKLPAHIQTVVDRNLGSHYRAAVGLAIAVARHFHVGTAVIRKVLARFHGLEGRQEYTGKVAGVHFVNDTTATIPEAAVAAIKRFREKARGKKLILIAGGQDKKLDFRAMADAVVQHVDALILLPGNATEKLVVRLPRGVAGVPSRYHAKTMRRAVRIARTLAQKGDWIILSPGAASFNLFINEFDRGKQFTDAVRGL